jgi:hypothetical protein
MNQQEEQELLKDLIDKWSGVLDFMKSTAKLAPDSACSYCVLHSEKTGPVANVWMKCKTCGIKKQCFDYQRGVDGVLQGKISFAQLIDVLERCVEDFKVMYERTIHN